MDRSCQKNFLLAAFGLLAFTLTTQQLDILDRWGQFAYDRLSGYLLDRAPRDDIVIVAIDQPSLQGLGRWPWSRRVHAQLIDNLRAAGAKAVLLDILFAEPDPLDPEADRELIRAVAANGKVVLPIAPEWSNQIGLSVTGPFPALAAVAARLGHADIEMDSDGVVRSTFLHAGLDASLWPSLALAVQQAGSPDSLAEMPSGLRLRFDASLAPGAWVRDGKLLIPFLSPRRPFPILSYRDVLTGDLEPGSLAGKFVLVGLTATGLGQRFGTPVSGESEPMAGIELHATILDALERGWLVTRLSPTMTFGIASVLLLLTLGAFASLPRLRGWPLFLLAPLATLAVTAGLLKFALHWFDPAPVLLTLALSIPLSNWYRLKQLASRLAIERETSAATLNSIGDGVITADAAGRIEYLNPAAEVIFGINAAQARGNRLEALLSPEAAGVVQRLAEQPSAAPLIIPGPLGLPRVVRVSAQPIRGENHQPRGTVLALSDVTESWRANQEMAHMATHDALTGLPNRALFMDRLEQAIAAGERGQSGFALLFIDLDGFKKVNDGLGHAAGDRVLTETAERLRASVRRSDTVARWGGDEFVVLLEELKETELGAEIAQVILRAMAEPFSLGDRVYVTASIGVSLFPKDGCAAHALLAGADAAMYQAKANGRNTVQYYAPEMNQWARERLELETELRTGLERGEFELYFQPQVATRNRAVVGFEALMRWRHRQRGLILPGAFIGLAEETGIINPLGEWALANACRQLKAWRANGLPPVSLSVNLSPRQFMQADLFDVIVNVVTEHELGAGQLTLEITESLTLSDLNHASRLLKRLKDFGVRISLDDFGTGYSSLEVLRRLPIDQIKIDKSFVQFVLRNDKDAAIARAMVRLAHELNMRVVAEGVETEAQLMFFQYLGCDSVQGYYSGRPMPIAEASELLANSQSLHDSTKSA